MALIRPPCKGFTLIEMIVVIGLISTLVSTGIWLTEEELQLAGVESILADSYRGFQNDRSAGINRLQNQQKYSSSTFAIDGTTNTAIITVSEFGHARSITVYENGEISE